jgi:hypothetical protein
MLFTDTVTTMTPQSTRGTMGKKQDKEEKFLIGIPDTRRDHYKTQMYNGQKHSCFTV